MSKSKNNSRSLNERLIASELSYRRLFEAAHDGIIIIELDTGKITDVNPFLTELLSFSREEILGKTVAELSPANDIVSNKAMLARLQKEGRVRYDDLPLQTKDGRSVAVEFVCNVYQAGDEKVIQCNVRDITLRRKMEEDLRESEEQFRTMFTSAGAGIAISTPQGRFLQVNQAYCQMLGYTEEELVQRDFMSITHPDDLTLNIKLRDEILEGKRKHFVMEKRYIKKGGEIVWTRHSVSAARTVNGKIETFIVIAEDITEQKLAEVKLRESEHRFSSAFEYAPIGVCLIGIDGKYLKVNRALCEILGYSEAELLSRSVFDVTHPEDIGLSKEKLRRFLADEIQTYQVDKRYIHKEGRTVLALLNVSIVRDGLNHPLYLIVQVQDVSERKRTEARFRRLVDSNVQGVIFWNKKGEITNGNDAFLKMTGYTRDDLKGGLINWAAMTPPEYAKLDERALEEIAATGICTLYEKEWFRKDGSRVPILLASAIFEDNSSEGLAFVLDLTEQKKTEEKLRQSLKMQTIGTLAGGIAHDFNNFLTIIQMQTHLVKSRGKLSSDQLKYVEIIDNATQRSSALTRQLLLFSRKQTMQLRDLNLNESVDQLGNMIRRSIGEDIELQLKLSEGPLFIRGDSSMLDQVLMNLAVNARDAMPKGGKLIIETSSVDFDKKSSAQIPKARAGSFVCLSLTDTGCGIPKENLPKIFEPFFTTKEVGKGTGLGLATVFGIVQQLNGWVNVYSEVGRGSNFRVYFPLLAASSLPASDSIPATSKPGGNETILYVEDDEFLSTAVCEILSQLGYEVLAARNSAEALEIWKARSKEIHLLLTDLVMPGKMSGKDLGEQLLRENPKLKVIFSSGYSAEIAGKDFHLQEGANFLTKPFEAHKLARVVRDCLDKRVEK